MREKVVIRNDITKYYRDSHIVMAGASAQKTVTVANKQRYWALIRKPYNR